MRLVKHTVRLPTEIDKAVIALAKTKGESVYAMLATCVEAGAASLAARPLYESADNELVAEVASISTRVAEVERMLERTLFTACAAYCYARSAAMGSDEPDEVIAAEVGRAYDRQKALAQAVDS